MKRYILIIIGLVVLGGGWFWLHGDKQKQATTVEAPKINQEEQQAKASELLVGMYTGTYKKNDAETEVILVLGQDKTATLTIATTSVEKGGWQFGEAEKIVVDIPASTKSSEAKKLVFDYDTTAGTLELDDYDKDVWGKGGLDLSKTLDLVGTTWVWLETTLADGTEVQADDKRSFRITFGEKNKLELTTDCNRVSASYKTNNRDELTIALGAMTEMACEGSHEGDFLKELGSVEMFTLEGSSLWLTLKDETGTMTFTRQ